MSLPLLLPIPGANSSSCSSEPSQCAACGESFGCGARSDGCWCVEIKLEEATRELLRTRYRSCLCRACLEKYADAANTGTLEPEQGGSELGTPR